MNNLDGWPFLVSCNRYLDYRTIVAPDFMCEIGDTKILANTAGGNVTAENVAFYREIHKSKVGKFTLVFRVIETTLEDMGIEGSGVLKDSFGREILLLEGIVIKGLIPDVIVTKNALEIAHGMLIQPYREFWECTRSEPATPSVCFSLPQDSSEFCLQYQRLQPYGVVPKIEVIEVKPKIEVIEVVDRPQVPVPVAVDHHRKNSRSQEWRSQRTNYFDAEVTSVTFLPKSNSVAIRYEHQQTIIISNFETTENTIFQNEDIKFTMCPTPITISHNGQYMATGVIKFGDNNVIKIWSIEEAKREHKEINGHKNNEFGRILAVAFTPDNQILLSGGKDRTIFFWDVKSGGKWGDPIQGFFSEIRAIAVSPDKDNSIFAIGDGEGRIEYWNWNSRRKIKSFPGSLNRSPINSLAFSPDGKILVSGGDDFSIKLWDVSRAEELKSGKHSSKVRTVAFSPDGKLIASGDDRGYIKIWDVETMQSMIVPRHDSAVTSVAFSPDGKTLASGSKDKTVRFWERV
ncbi:WD40 repeat domain-containing protein [Argonema galeatum]|uniref:WD40 repeat domain-containing protein n=1 Tax=Argonema galeatum TaxID=2942762 RepID=UPI0020118E56|nr:WD40 repeat domain-containing protein [Argonema galeatum]MCL1468120.1 WD40 repeat domain-containing protein [Argonema galeatum A003/A1]